MSDHEENALLEGVESDDEVIENQGDDSENNGFEPDEAGDQSDPFAWDGDEDTGENAEETPDDPESPDRFAGKSKDDVVKSYTELEGKMSKMGNELGELRKMVAELKSGDSDDEEGILATTSENLMDEESVQDPEKVVGWFNHQNERFESALKRVDDALKKLSGDGEKQSSGPSEAELKELAEYQKQHNISDAAMGEIGQWAQDESNWTLDAVVAAYNATHGNKIPVDHAPAGRLKSDGGSGGEILSEATLKEIGNTEGEPGIRRWLSNFHGKDLARAENMVTRLFS